MKGRDNSEVRSLIRRFGGTGGGGGGGPVAWGDIGGTLADQTDLQDAIDAAAGFGGAATLDFGAAPGSSTASVAVTGQAGILSGSRVRAWVQGSTSDHNAYEHSRIFPNRIGLGVSDIVAGTGFTIHAETELRLTGDVAVKWEWA